MVHFRRFPAAALSLFLSACAGGASGPFTASECPVNPEAGYPLSVSSPERILPKETLDGLANSFARRWQVPSRSRRSYPGAEDVRVRLSTPEPRWADDWVPGADHIAEMSVILHLSSERMETEVVAASGDRVFDESLPRIFSPDPVWAFPIPTFPDGEIDPVRLIVRFGHRPGPGDGVVRFAVHQTPVRMIPGSDRIARPSSGGGPVHGQVTVMYDVGSDGSVIPNSVYVIRSPSPLLSEAVLRGIQGARFRPAQSNCRPIAQSVIQVIGF